MQMSYGRKIESEEDLDRDRKKREYVRVQQVWDHVTRLFIILCYVIPIGFVILIIALAVHWTSAERWDILTQVASYTFTLLMGIVVTIAAKFGIAKSDL